MVKGKTIRRKMPRPGSKAEAELAIWMRTAPHIPAPVREFRFHPTRQWRFDFAWPAHRFAIEIDGIVGNGKGRHQTAAGMRGDLEKLHEAHMLGWKVYRCSGDMISSGRVLEAIELEICGVPIF
jgi:very-short-patch-repair endonuclease